MEDVGQGAERLVQVHFPALDAAHVQDVVDQAHQMVSGGEYFFQILLHLVLPVDVGDGQGGKAHDGVHGGADIVGHVGQEHALGLAGPVGLGEGVLQQGLLLHLTLRLLVHVAEAQNHHPAVRPVANAHHLHLEVLHFVFAYRPVIDGVDPVVLQLPLQCLRGAKLLHEPAVLDVNAVFDVLPHTFLHLQLPVKHLLQNTHGAVVHPKGFPDAGIQVKGADQAEINAQCLDQLRLAALLLHPRLVLPPLLGGAVQQEPLVKQLAVLLHQLDIAHNVEGFAVPVANLILNVDVVAHLAQACDAGVEPLPVLIRHRGDHHVKSIGDHVLCGLVAQDFQRRPVDAEDALAVNGVAHHAAVHRGKERLQLSVLIDDLLLVGPLLGNVDGNAHRSHHHAVHVVQGGFIGCQQPGPIAGLYRLLRDAGLSRLHNDPLRLNTGGIVELHIPDIGVAPALYLVFCLVDRLAEAVVHFLVNTILRLIPN